MYSSNLLPFRSLAFCDIPYLVIDSKQVEISKLFIKELCQNWNCSFMIGYTIYLKDDLVIENQENYLDD